MNSALNAATRYKPNTWLVTNTSLFFADQLLEGTYKYKVDFYRVSELSKLSEAILLADRIVTLAGGELDTMYMHELRGKGLLEDIEEEESALISPGLDEIYTKKKLPRYLWINLEIAIKPNKNL